MRAWQSIPTATGACRGRGLPGADVAERRHRLLLCVRDIGHIALGEDLPSELRYLPAALIAPTLLLFMMAYLGWPATRLARWLQSSGSKLIFTIPVIAVLLSLSGEVHRIPLQLPAPFCRAVERAELRARLGLVHLFCLYLRIDRRRAGRVARRRATQARQGRYAWAILVGILIGGAADVLFILGLTPTSGFLDAGYLHRLLLAVRLRAAARAGVRLHASRSRRCSRISATW